MARGINKVILVGNLGRDPEMRYTPSGSAVANLALATSESWKDKQTGENQERTEWHRIVMFNRLAEIAGEYLKKGSIKKGSKLYIEGKLQTRKWQDKEGQDRYTTEIVGNEMQMLDSRGGGGMGGGMDNFDQSAPTQQRQQAPQAAAPQAAQQKGAFDDFDDDIPF